MKCQIIHLVGEQLTVINEDNSKHPQCKHGPTLLFCRQLNNSNQIEKFYACSACRNRNECPFYLPVNKVKLDVQNNLVINCEKTCKLSFGIEKVFDSKRLV